MTPFCNLWNDPRMKFAKGKHWNEHVVITFWAT